MNKRIASIDVLRGISIFMMVLCSAIAWNAGLPAWMFHGQVPPPDYVFNPDIKGITWVDLVFPFFIFSMGASMPFALGSRLDRGLGLGRISLDIVKRWLILAAFAVVLGNAGSIFSYTELPKVAVRLGIWAGMFFALWRVPKDSRLQGWAVNLGGAGITMGMLSLEHTLFGVELSFHNINIIIMVLSSLALLGGFTWLLTRERPWIRAAIFLVACVLKEVCWHWNPLQFLSFPQSVSWLLNWRYAMYMVVLLVGMSCGDMLRQTIRKEGAICPSPSNWNNALAAVLCAALIPAMLWAFFTRNVWLGLDFTAACALIFLYLTRNENGIWTVIARMGFCILALGVVFDPIDGGITKDHCNLSYMLSTAGMACLALAFLLWCEAYQASRGAGFAKLLSLTGQNPMIAYTISGFVIYPLLWLCGFGKLDIYYPGHPLLGFTRGVFLTMLMVLATSYLSSRKIYWRS